MPRPRKKNTACHILSCGLSWSWLITGCTSPLPAPIDGFDRQTNGQTTSDHSSATNDWETIDSEQGPAMQVMICLGNAYGTHTGLRLIDAGNHVLFWDPAGHYGIGTVEIPRRRDVIDEDAPTLAQYVKWRIKGARDDTVVVYEWGLSTRRADELRAILSGDPTRTPGGEAFDTTTIGLFCCKAVCEFLDRFASPEITVPEYWFRPEHLGKHLWTQQPTRVLIYRANAPTQIWLPDSDR